MAFKVFAPGVLTSSDVNTFLMRQAVITCTSSTRPASPSEGMTIYETDTDLYATYTGTAWLYVGGYQTYTPVLSGTGWTFKGHTAYGMYAEVGDLVHSVMVVIWDGTGSQTAGAGAISMSLPTSAATGSAPSSRLQRSNFGHFQMYDDSLDLRLMGTARVNGTSTCFLGVHIRDGSVTAAVSDAGIVSSYVSSGAPAPVDADDYWSVSIAYRKA